MDNKDGIDSDGMILPVENGVNGATDSRHTRSPTAISFAASESATLGGGTGSAFVNSGKGGHLEGLPETGGQTQPVREGGRRRIPNITVPEKHKNRTLVLCFDGTGDQ